jgi:epoxide hydrolase 4
MRIQDGQYFAGAALSAARSDKVKLHYAVAGTPNDEVTGQENPLMICLHGFPEFWRAYADVMPLLAQDFWVVAPDLRGFNLSDKPAEVESYKASLIIADVMALAAHLGRQSFVLVAHDWGGAIAWNLALAHPKAVKKLIILNAPHPVPFAKALAHNKAQQDASQYMNWLRAPGSEHVLAQNNCERLSGFFGQWGSHNSPATWFSGATKNAYLAAWLQQGAINGGVNYYRASPLYPPVTVNGQLDIGAQRLTLDPQKFIIKVPTKVIWGDGDVALLPVLVEELPPLVDSLIIERWPDASHWLLHEHPERCAQSILAYAK